MFQHILCPIDFSKLAERALDHAIAWAEHDKCALELVHVIQPVVYAAPELGPLYSDLDARTARELEDQMRERVKKLRVRVPGVTGHVLRGFPANEITLRAKTSKADLVVMGTSGAGAVARAVLGSVADRVLRSSPAPVLLVPHEGRAVSMIPKRIVAPTDFSPAAKAAVARARALADELGAALDVVHAYELPSVVERDPTLAHALRSAMSVEVHAEHPELVEQPNIRARGMEGPAAATIVRLTEDANADLVLMASSGRGLVSSLLLGGVTDRVVRTSHVPVLVLRPNA